MKPIQEIEKIIERKLQVTAGPGLHNRILANIRQTDEYSRRTITVSERPMPRRLVLIRPIGGLAIAAVVVVALLLGISLINSTSNVTWAKVLEKVNGFETYIFCTHEVETTGPRPSGFEFVREGGSKRYYSEAYGSLTEGYQDNGELFNRVYTLPQKKEVVAIYYPLETYSRHALTEAQVRKFYENTIKHPKPMIAKILAAGYTEMGGDLMQGKTVRGIEVRDPTAIADGRVPPVDDFSLRLWIDVETELPVWVEMSVVPKGSPTRHTTIFDQFEWGPPLEAELFEPNIPAGFERVEQTDFYTDSAPKTDAAKAFAANTQAEPYLGDFSHLVLPDISRVKLLGVDPAKAQTELRLRNHEDIWHTQDRFLAKWPRYREVEAQLVDQLEAQLGIGQMTVEELVALGMAFRERFWKLRGCLSDNAYPYAYAARLITKMAHEQASDNDAVTDQYVESIMTAEVTTPCDEDEHARVWNPLYPGLLTELRSRQFERLKVRVSRGHVPQWKDYVRANDLIILLNSYGEDYTGALAATRWLIAQAQSAGWTYYVDRDLVPAEKAFVAGERSRPGLFMYDPDTFPEEYRYARRLFSFQGPAQRRASILPIHLRHLKGW